MTYESWRISFQSSEQAARAAYSKAEELAAERDALAAKLAELEGQEPVATLHNASGCVGGLSIENHAPDLLEAGMKLYARPVPAAPVNARLLEALRTNHQWHIDFDDFDGYPGSELEATNLAAIAAAEAHQAVLLTDEDLVDLFQAWNTTDGTSYADLILAAETAVLERNGLNPQAKGD